MHVVGARPNFMKLSPVYAALSEYADIQQIVVHTGQHYNHNMSQIFFEQFGIASNWYRTLENRSDFASM
jgi:UDP-N-acetylglucosamine 2-epimerase (non-hydrolysing)